MKPVIFILLIGIFFNAVAQQQYTLEKNIFYYNDSAKKDRYTAAQCVLDLYYPANIKNFATIIWFHGGSLTGGDKEIPAQLMNKGYAIAGIQYRLSPNVKAPAYIEDAAAAVA